MQPMPGQQQKSVLVFQLARTPCSWFKPTLNSSSVSSSVMLNIGADPLDTGWSIDSKGSSRRTGNRVDTENHATKVSSKSIKCSMLMQYKQLNIHILVLSIVISTWLMLSWSHLNMEKRKEVLLSWVRVLGQIPWQDKQRPNRCGACFTLMDSILDSLEKKEKKNRKPKWRADLDLNGMLIVMFSRFIDTDKLTGAHCYVKITGTKRYHTVTF